MVRRLMAKKPEQRHGSAAEVAELLKWIMQASPDSDPAVPTPT
jgi:hypothetical protein